VVVGDAGMTNLYAHFHLPANCRTCFDLSRDGQYLAAGYEYVDPSHIDVWEVATGRNVARIPKTHASEVYVHSDGRYLVYWSAFGRSGPWVCDMITGQRENVKGAFGLASSGRTHDGKALLLLRNWGLRTRSGRRGCFRLTFDPFSVSPLPLPASRNVWVLACSPADDTFVILEDGETVSCVRLEDSGAVWRQQVPETGWISYTGDGRFVALEQHAPAGGGAARIVVLDARSGEIVRKIEQPEQGRFPLDGPRVLCLSGRFANLETGEIEPGVSDIRRWYSLIGYPECDKDRPMGEFEKWSHDQARRLGADESWSAAPEDAGRLSDK